MDGYCCWLWNGEGVDADRDTPICYLECMKFKDERTECDGRNPDVMRPLVTKHKRIFRERLTVVKDFLVLHAHWPEVIVACWCNGGKHRSTAMSIYLSRLLDTQPVHLSLHKHKYRAHRCDRCNGRGTAAEIDDLMELAWAIWRSV